jgi:hypothetical protein
MMAIAHIMKDQRPDLILSGVNRGANLGEDVTYSGTVSAAMEGALAGIPSIALSQSYAKEGMGDTVPFAAAEAWGVKVLRPIVESPMEPRTLVNINFPALSPEDVKACGHAAGPARLRPAAHRPAHRSARLRLFLVRLGPMLETPGHSTDLEAGADGYVSSPRSTSISPTHLRWEGSPSCSPDVRAPPRSPDPQAEEPASHLGADRLAGRPCPRSLLFVLAVHWFERDGLKDGLDGHVSFTDVIYFTMVSITTTGYGDIVPVSQGARLFDALLVTPIRIFFVLIFIGTAYQLVFRRSWEKWRMERIQRGLSGHVIIAGFGISGAEALDELLARGQAPHQVVVIDPDPAALERPHELGCATGRGRRHPRQDPERGPRRGGPGDDRLGGPGRYRHSDHPHGPPPGAQAQDQRRGPQRG